MSETRTRPARDVSDIKIRETIGVSLMGSEESRAIVDYVLEMMPDATVVDNDCYFKIERDGLLEFNMAELSERLGRPYTEHDFLVSMTTYYGRIVVNDGIVSIYADILPERFRD